MSSLRYRFSARPVRPPLACLLGLLLLAGVVLFLPAPVYGSSPPMWSHTVDAHPSWTGHVAQLPAIPWLPALRLASAAGGAGVVQGHVYDYSGSPVANAAVSASVRDDQGNWLWGQDATTNATGAYSVSGAPASAHGGSISVSSETGLLFVKGLAFADPGPSTYDLRPARVSWSATRGGPWAHDWRDPGIEVAGMSAAATPVYAYTVQHRVSTAATVTGWASALPADVRLVAFSFSPDEVALWDAADPGNSPVPVTVGSTTALPSAFDEASAYRIFFTKPYWASGKPGTVLRLAMENFPAGTKVDFTGYSEKPDSVSTTIGTSHTSTGPQKQTVSLTVPAKAAPGYDFDVWAAGPTRYNVYQLSLEEFFQVCTLNATKRSISRGTAVKLRGVVPVKGHWGSAAGIRKYVWIYKRTKSASAPPRVWDATKKGWKLVARVRSDRYGRYHSALLTPARTTWYVARYAGDDQYWRAYTSVRKVRVH